MLELLVAVVALVGTQVNPVPGEAVCAPPSAATGRADAHVYSWPPLFPRRGSFVLVDRETKSTFNLRGEAIAGPLAKKKRRLRQIPGVNMFWFAWSVFFPGSEIWGRGERVRQGKLPEDKRGWPACGPGMDCIPSLPNIGPPKEEVAWVRADSPEAAYLVDSDLVLGIFFGGVARAYPHKILSWHEIVNDRIGNQRFSVTFCPLTGSGVAFSAGERGDTFGVSGNLFNSNLVMYDHRTQSLWPQLWMGAVSGSSQGTWLTQLPLSEMTWGKWKELYPNTFVLSQRTGHARDYTRYPYGNYRTDHDDTFRPTTPPPDPLYPNKTIVFGLVDRRNHAAKAYVHSDLAAKAGPRSVIHDGFAGRPIVIAYEQAAQLVLAFDAETPEGVLTFEAHAYTPEP